MIAVIIGLASGICTGMGLGGGSVLILLLDLFLNFDQHIAQATNILCFVPSAIISILVSMKNKNIKFCYFRCCCLILYVILHYVSEIHNKPRWSVEVW